MESKIDQQYAKAVIGRLKVFDKNNDNKLNKVIQVDPNKLDKFIIVFTPKGGIYEGQTHILDMTTINGKDKFPFAPPILKFRTSIWHANVGKEGNICLDILNDSNKWCKQYGFTEVISSILTLLDTPNPSSPLNAAAGSAWVQCKKEKKSEGKTEQERQKIQFAPFIEMCNKYYQEHNKVLVDAERVRILKEYGIDILKE